MTRGKSMGNDYILGRTLMMAGVIMMANSTLAQHLNSDFKNDFKRQNNKDNELKLNEEAIKLIKFDFRWINRGCNSRQIWLYRKA